MKNSNKNVDSPAAPIHKALHENRMLRIREANERRQRLRPKVSKPKKVSVRDRIEEDKRIKNEFFKHALSDFDTKPFLRTWDETSNQSMEEVLELSSKSLALIDGFELANRAITGPIGMPEAGVELKYVMEFARKTSKVAFFELVLRKSGIEERWRDLMMKFFIAKEMGVGTSVMESQLTEAVRELANKPVEKPFGETTKTNTVVKAAPKRRPVSEVGRERARKYFEKITAELHAKDE